MSVQHDVIIVGGGPAGAQCALWLTKIGVSCLLLEPDRIGGLQARSPYTNSWLSVVQATTTAKSVASNMQKNLTSQGCARLRASCRRIERSDTGFGVITEQGRMEARFVVLATGTQEKTGGLEGDPRAVIGLIGLDAIEGAPGRVAILGGGDAAAESYAILSAAGAVDLKVFARSVQARPNHWSAIAAESRYHGPYKVGDGVISYRHERFEFDRMVVCYGWQPALPELAFELDVTEAGYVRVDADMQTSQTGVFAIGDVNERPYPCVATAMSDGVYAANVIQSVLHESR
ncbi:MAG: NAD(P)/FAD-dependent oxidoreductase [Pseudomonadota bacterium]